MKTNFRSGLLKAITLTVIFYLSLNGILAMDMDLVKVKSLSGGWKFSIGEQDAWTSPGYNDSGWDVIQVPSPWEEQGFHGYNGFGFYRKSFTISAEYKDKNLYLFLGYIDDVDETYLNGYKIGSTGSMPPKYVTAYNAKRVYRITKEMLNFNGPNVLAVKVYDSYDAGGIVSGEVGLYLNLKEIPLEISLEGQWKFQPGDALARKSPSFDDSKWKSIIVPGKWEDQGYRDYDGYAWYRKSFTYKGSIKEETSILYLGKIDDVDEVYINGTKVGMTADHFGQEGQKIPTGAHYQALRGYYFSTSLLKPDQKNTISIRVYDSGGEGGIYEGPVGIISQTKYIQYWRDRKKQYR